MSKVIRFKDDGSYSILDSKEFVYLTIDKHTPQSEEPFQYVWRSIYRGLLRYTPNVHNKHQSISLNELPEFVRALIILHDI